MPMYYNFATINYEVDFPYKCIYISYSFTRTVLKWVEVCEYLLSNRCAGAMGPYLHPTTHVIIARVALLPILNYRGKPP